MQPQGTAPTNTEYFTKLTDQISGCTVCSDLQDQVNAAMATLQAYKSSITAQIELLGPILALLEVPTDPIAVVTWVGKFISGFLTPYVVPYTTYVTQLTDLVSQVEGLASAITEAAGKIKGGCSITVPPLT